MPSRFKTTPADCSRFGGNPLGQHNVHSSSPAALYKYQWRKAESFWIHSTARTRCVLVAGKRCPPFSLFQRLFTFGRQKCRGGQIHQRICRASAGVGALQHAAAHSITSGSPHARLEKLGPLGRDHCKACRAGTVLGWDVRFVSQHPDHILRLGGRLPQPVDAVRRADLRASEIIGRCGS